MTNQQAFNKAARHLLKQGVKSISPDKSDCRYRGPRGTSCAIGCLVPRTTWRPHHEGMNVATLRGDGFLPRALRDLDIDLLAELQVVHDCRPIPEWPERLRSVATEFKLTLPRCLQ